jgi:hypothetical protein
MPSSFGVQKRNLRPVQAHDAFDRPCFESECAHRIIRDDAVLGGRMWSLHLGKHFAYCPRLPPGKRAFCPGAVPSDHLESLHFFSIEISLVLMTLALSSISSAYDCVVWNSVLFSPVSASLVRMPSIA